MREQQAIYNSIQTDQFAQFTKGLHEAAVGKTGTFDSAAATEYISGAQNQNAAPMPKLLKETLDSVGEEHSSAISRAILDGVKAYEMQHGVAPTADVIEAAVHQGFSTTDAARSRYNLLDSASSMHHDQMSLQPNRAVIAIMSAISEAIPVANYLPVDIGSNEAKLIIVSHTAGTAFGGYALNANMDGIASGYAYATGQRIHTLTRTSDAFGDKLTAIQTTPETCDQSAAAVKLLKGRANVYVNGYLAATEVNGYGNGASSAIAGTATIGSTDYAISGTINVDTGVVAITTSPALPANTPVVVESYIDYERSPGIIPLLNTNAEAFKLFANSWKVSAEQSIETRTQFANELGLDPAAESMLAIRNQVANERHYDVLYKAARLGANNVQTYNFNFSNRSLQMNRSQIWNDFAALLGAMSQQMAEDTLDHGITHLYVSKNVMSNFQGLPREIFEPSGVTQRPGIFRVGRLFGLYEVYYTPRVAEDTSSTASKIIAIGRSTQVARNPFVLGDAVAPTVQPLTLSRDQFAGSTFYARNFTSVNPHRASAKGCAVINVTNLA